MLTRSSFSGAALELAEVCSTVEEREETLLTVTRAMAENGWLEEAEAHARTAEHLQHRYARLAAVAVAAGRSNDPIRAERLTIEVEAGIDNLPEGQFRRHAALATAVASADAGHYGRTETLVEFELVPHEDATGILSVAVAYLRGEHTDRAVQLLETVEHTTRSTRPEVNEQQQLNWIDVMTDFQDFSRAEATAHSLQDPAIKAASWERIAEHIATTGDFDRFTNALTSVTQPERQRRPRMEMIRVLLARGDLDHATELARTTPTTRHQVAALAFVAERINSRDLLNEAVNLAITIDNFEEQAMALVSTLRAAANLTDRTTVEFLLKLLKPLHDRLSERSNYSIANINPVPTFLGRSESMTQIVETIDNSPNLEQFKTPPHLRSSLTPLWIRTSQYATSHQGLARALTLMNWMEIVDRVVKVDPRAYPAIVQELDRLNRSDADPESLTSTG
ncbi:hypothetical protein [Actinokineospora inagensis]|uniref:hypothetical protein n=1 Tax=Actinokineospora inagensis TaxID=103730 RepID=UPI0012FB30EB|nr:hypothetical protein [Actinokineospora inagensis]